MPKRKIMIIDDDRELLEEIKEILISKKVETVTYVNGSEALSMVSIDKPDLILLDINIEGKNGFQFANELKLFPELAYIPIIAITGFYTEEEYKMLMNFLGIKDILIKPFAMEVLLEKIFSIIEKND